MPYNLTEAGNSTNLFIYTQNINDLTGGIFVPMFLIVSFILMFTSLKGWAARDSFAASSFVTALLSVLFWTMQLISDTILIIFILFAGLGAVLLFMRGET